MVSIESGRMPCRVALYYALSDAYLWSGIFIFGFYQLLVSYAATISLVFLWSNNINVTWIVLLLFYRLRSFILIAQEQCPAGMPYRTVRLGPVWSNDDVIAIALIKMCSGVTWPRKTHWFRVSLRSRFDESVNTYTSYFYSGPFLTWLPNESPLTCTDILKPRKERKRKLKIKITKIILREHRSQQPWNEITESSKDLLR